MALIWTAFNSIGIMKKCEPLSGSDAFFKCAFLVGVWVLGYGARMLDENKYNP